MTHTEARYERNDDEEKLHAKSIDEVAPIGTDKDGSVERNFWNRRSEYRRIYAARCRLQNFAHIGDLPRRVTRGGAVLGLLDQPFDVEL